LEWIDLELSLEDIDQRLAKQLTRGPAINLVEGCEIARIPKEIVFLGIIVIKPKDIAEKEAKNIYKLDRVNLDLIIWSDGLKLEIEDIGIGIALKQGKTWF
jgi:hypothetical protein